jgi:glycine betaine/choline ABC-type transport system substrate-binding protein
VVAKLREKLAVSKQAAQKFDGGKFNLRKLNEAEVKNKYQIEITNRFAALENLNTDEEVNRVGKQLMIILNPQRKRALFCMN